MNTLPDYLSFAQAHPALFVNPPGGFTILLNEGEIREVEAQMVKRLKVKKLPTEWAQIGIVYQDQYGLILRDAVQFPSGALGTYIRFVSNADGGFGVIVLPLYQRQVLLIRRFRHATRTWHLEIPLGTGMKRLSPEEIARRELTQEIGATVSRLVSLGQLDSSGPGMASSSTKLFYAEIESYGNVDMRAGIIELLLVTVPEFEHMISMSEITDSFTIIAYTYAKLQGLF
jgi:ADP-ribose pyrophosphatase